MALSFLKALLESLEVEEEVLLLILIVLDVLQNLCSDCHSVDSVAELHKGYHEKVFLLDRLQKFTIEKLMDNRICGLRN
jgi:hypothetical protein